MNILYIGRFEPYHRTECYVTHALETLGHSVFKFPIESYTNLNTLKWEAEACNADVVLFAKSEHDCFPAFTSWCATKGITTVTWLWDLYFGCRKRVPVIAFMSDLVFSTDGGNVEDWKNYREDVEPHRTLRQGIHLPDAEILEPNYRYDVGFVGHDGTLNRQPGRTALLNFLKGNYQGRFVHHTETRGHDLNVAL